MYLEAPSPCSHKHIVRRPIFTFIRFLSRRLCILRESLESFQGVSSLFPARQGPKSPEKGFRSLKFRKWEVARGAVEPSFNKISCPADTADD